jgi:hypothetical protein
MGILVHRYKCKSCIVSLDVSMEFIGLFKILPRIGANVGEDLALTPKRLNVRTADKPVLVSVT